MQRGPDTHSRFATARRGQLHDLPFSLALLCVGLAGIALPATAQVATAQVATETPTPAVTPSPDAIQQREQELEATRAQQKSAAEAQEKLLSLIHI